MSFKQFKKFPAVFWGANLTELFERAAFYAMASFVVLYLKQLGFGSYWPSTLNGLLWGIVYLLPIISGSMADHFGFRKALIMAFVLLSVGYLMMGLPVWTSLGKRDTTILQKKVVVKKTIPSALAKSSIKLKDNKKIVKPATLGVKEVKPALPVKVAPVKSLNKDVAKISKQGGKKGLPVTVPPVVFAMIIFALIIIGIGGSIIKPCISGAVQKFSPTKLAALGFGIFYMVINLGSLLGRSVSYFVRINTNLSYIFAVSGAMAILALFAVILKYKEPPKEEGEEKKDLKQTFLNMFLVLKQVRFMLFLVLVTGFAFIYHQVYNIIPLYLEHFVEDSPPIELYTMANPIVVVFFQLAVTKFFGGMKPVRSIVVGMLLISLAMFVNIIPLLMHTDLRSAVMGTLPLGGLYAILTVALIAFGELFEASRRFEFIGKLAPKGQEGLYMGYANLPMALGSFIGGPLGAWIFNDIMVAQDNQVLGWAILGIIGIVSALGILGFAIWIEKTDSKEAKTTA